MYTEMIIDVLKITYFELLSYKTMETTFTQLPIASNCIDMFFTSMLNIDEPPAIWPHA